MTIKIKQLPESERPYEKLELYGEKMLSNAELLAIIIKSGTKENTSVELANKVLSLSDSKSIGISSKKFISEKNAEKLQKENKKQVLSLNETNRGLCDRENLSNELHQVCNEDVGKSCNQFYIGGANNNLLQSLQEISLEEFQTIKGIGKVKAIQLKAVCELARRMAQPVNKKSIKISSSLDVAQLLMEELRFEKVEYVKLLLLNAKNIVVRVIDISKGGMNSAIVEPKEVLKEAIRAGIPKIILVHNHPSGDSTPSKADIEMTKRLYEAASIVGIQLLDHIVIGNGCYTSIFSAERIV
ncbi:MAG: DNA repair protein RadC [Clostridia bacterium]|nr:DNA repair protein RadC [Clostridia bacterium]